MNNKFNSLKKNKLFKFLIIVLIIINLINNLKLSFSRDKYKELQNFIFKKGTQAKFLELLNKSNIDTDKEFFQITQVRQQIYRKNINYVDTISGGKGNVGNALIMLNKLINICEIIGCRNIITPKYNHNQKY